MAKRKKQSRKIPVPRDLVYRLLGPCPVVLVSSLPKGAKARTPLRVCTVAWCMPLDYDPPKAALVIASGHRTTQASLETGELAISIPGADLVDEVMGVGTTSSVEVDKCRRFGLTPERSRRIKAPGIAEALAILECRILEWKTPLGRKLQEGYDLMLVEILEARAERGAFAKRWRPEKGGSILAHLGGSIFGIPSEIVRGRK